MGIFIGMVLCMLAIKTIHLPHGAPISYSSVFFFFTVMNISALLFLCLLPAARNWTASLIAFFSEGFATSAVGLSLFVAALTDAGLVKDCSPFKLILTVVGYLAILYGWVQTVFFLVLWPYSIAFLYFGIPTAGFISYYTTQIVWLFRSSSRQGSGFLALSFVSFITALSSVTISIHNCELLPSYFSGEMIWFFCLTLSFFFLFKYYITRSANPPAYTAVCVEEGKVVDAEPSTIEALYPQSTMETKDQH